MPDPDPSIQTLAAGRFLNLVRRGPWEYATRPGPIEAVAVIAVTDDRQLVLVEQHRVPVDRPVLELPAGLARDQEHIGEESLLDAARRELLEETGYEASDWSPAFHAASSAGLTDETVHVFQARGLTRVHAGGGVEGEAIHVHHAPVADLPAWLRAREAEGLLIDARVFAAAWVVSAPT